MADATTYEPSPSEWVREQVEKFESSGGVEGATHGGVPIVLLTMVGAKSGKIRKVPLMRVEHQGEYLAVASKGGAPENPLWFNNIVAKPELELQDGTIKKFYTARLIEGAEYETWWERAVAVWPDYAEYAKKTDRRIPLFLLTPKV